MNALSEPCERKARTKRAQDAEAALEALRVRHRREAEAAAASEARRRKESDNDVAIQDNLHRELAAAGSGLA